MSKTKTNLLFIINPISGTKGKIQLKNIIPQVLSDELFACDLYYTTGRGDAVQKSKNAIGKYDIVVAVGGDGTINEVAQGLVHSNTPMAVIPNGSGNGFANYFDISKKPTEALKKLIQPNISLIDTGTFNGELFLSVAGLGFDAKVAHAFDQYGKRGFISYSRITLKKFLKYKPKNYQINIDGQIIKRRAFFITIANSTQFGNNAYIAPKAKIDDGWFDVVIISPLKWYHLFNVAFRIFNKTIMDSSLCETVRGKNIHIKTKDHFAHIDGEPMRISKSNEIQIKPHSLRMVI